MSTSTSVEKVKPFTTQELQDSLDAADATLTDDVRRRFPIVERSTIDATYPDEWIAFFPTTVDDRHRIVGGRVLAHTADLSRLEEELTLLEADNPDVRFYSWKFYTGRQPFGEHFVYVRF